MHESHEPKAWELDVRTGSAMWDVGVMAEMLTGMGMSYIHLSVWTMVRTSWGCMR